MIENDITNCLCINQPSAGKGQNVCTDMEQADFKKKESCSQGKAQSPFLPPGCMAVRKSNAIKFV